MEKTNSLNGKIKRYAALAGGVVTSAAASAQVAYTDVTPDAVITTGGTSQYTLDIDGDLTAEMAFIVQEASGVTGTYAGYTYTATYGAAAAAFGTSAASTNGWMASTSGDIANLSTSNMIGSSGSFNQSQGVMGIEGDLLFFGNTYPISSGNFLGQEGFVGVRFDISGSTHYGWARVEVSADGKTLTVKDYAYDQTAGTAIAAGDVGTGIDELAMENLVTFINSQVNKVLVKSQGLTNGTINVVGIDGKSISSTKIANNSELVDLNGLAAGIYVVNVTANEGFISKKVYVR
jgi:hypothetical protein